MPIDFNALSGVSNATTPSPIQAWLDRPPGSDPLASSSQSIDPSSISPSLAVAGGVSLLSYPDETPKYYMMLGTSVYDRTDFMQVTVAPKGFIRLPLPMGLIDNHAVDFSNEPFPLIGNISSIYNKLASTPGYADSVMKNRLTASSTVDNRSFWQKVRDNANIGQAPSRTITAYAPNQFLTILLKGPKYKKFQFHWRFSPKTPSESNSLQKIIRRLNDAMSPALAYARTVFEFPEVFTLAIMPNSRYMYKFKPAVLEEFNVNYTPAGQPAFFRSSNVTTAGTDASGTSLGNLNAPEGVEISMQFLELEFWLYGDYGATTDDNDPLNTRGPRGSRGLPGAEAAATEGQPIQEPDPNNPGALPG